MKIPWPGPSPPNPRAERQARTRRRIVDAAVDPYASVVPARLALGYFTWRSLARESGLDRASAVRAMVRAAEASPAGLPLLSSRPIDKRAGR